MNKMVDLEIKARVAAKKAKANASAPKVPPRVPTGGGDMNRVAQPPSMDSYLDGMFASLRVK